MPRWATTAKRSCNGGSVAPPLAHRRDLLECRGVWYAGREGLARPWCVHENAQRLRRTAPPWADRMCG
eukprot:7376382-Prymnesium_polylepis.1